MPLNGRSPRRVASDTLPIQDRRRLAKIVSQLISPFGSQRAASLRLGIPQTQLSRMVNRELGELSRKNVKRLFESVAPAQRKRLVRAFEMRSPADLRRAYLAWIEEQRGVASRGASRRWFRTFHGLGDEERRAAPVGESDRDAERQALWSYVKELDPVFGRGVDVALGKVRDSGYQEVALIRILDPLINGPDSGFIEPSWREWRTDEKGRRRLMKFLRLGFERETLLLHGRLRTSERAMNVLKSPRDDFISTYGDSAKPRTIQRNPFELLRQSGYLHGANRVKESP